MRITGLPGPVQNLLLSALPKAVDFAVTEQAAVPVPQPSTAAQPVSVQMLVTLASVEPAIERRRRAAVVADTALTALERLDQALLAGLVPVEQLHEVAAQSETLNAPHDPELHQILQEIDLRIRVELAKHDIVV